MINFSAFHALHRIRAGTLSSELGFRYIAIPDNFESEADEPFDPREMKRLFELGYEMGSAGSAWRYTPPGYLPEQ